MKAYTDQEIVKGILKEDRKVLQYIYKKWSPMIDRMVINLGGNGDDAKDIFQEALLVVYRKAKAGELNLCCKFSTYLFSVGHKLWIQELKSAEMKNIRFQWPDDVVCEPEPEKIDESVLFDLVEKHMNDLSTDCQKILRLHFNRASIEQIAKIMGYKDKHHTMDRKYRCKQSLMKRLMNDPLFKEIKDELIRENRSLY